MFFTAFMHVDDNDGRLVGILDLWGLKSMFFFVRVKVEFKN